MPDAYIPYGAYWSTPFARWQGSFSHLNAIEFAAHTAKSELARRKIAPDAFDYGVLGTTIPQHHSFYGTPWLFGMMGAPHVSGPTIAQACATSARCLQNAAQEVSGGEATAALIVTADRTSNGPHVYYPAPAAPGGTGQSENWVLDNFGRDPFARSRWCRQRRMSRANTRSARRSSMTSCCAATSNTRPRRRTSSRAS
jgi:acetyl-CoA acetyltransferase